jgi:hypothetical protein
MVSGEKTENIIEILLDNRSGIEYYPTPYSTSSSTVDPPSGVTYPHGVFFYFVE